MTRKVYYNLKRLPTWKAESPKADDAIAEFMEAVIRAMEIQGRARNIVKKPIKGGIEFWFERRSTLKFKSLKHSEK